MAIQYTLRNIPTAVDKALKKKAKRLNKSFNQTVVDELIASTLNTSNKSSFDWLANTLTDNDAEEFDQTIKDLNISDPEFWK